MENINLKIENLRNDLVAMINQSELPIAVIELICKELYTKVQNNYIAYINTERIKEMRSAEDMAKEIQGEESVKIEEALDGQGK